jgi:hypothetical protein
MLDFSRGDLMSIELEIKGIKELFRKLDSIDAVRVLEPPMQRAVLRIEGRMKTYPPTRPGQKYVRTGTLGRNWVTKVDKRSDGITGTVGNSRTTYGPFVQSARFQRPIFRGRWQTDVDVLESEKDAILRDFERAIAEAI